MQADVTTPSLLSPLGYQATHCGYCKKDDTSQRTPNSRAAYYAQSRLLTVSTYQALMDRGWRRSGSLLYKPDILRACCPHYTIRSVFVPGQPDHSIEMDHRLPAASIKPSKDQRQALNRWNRFVLGEDYIAETSRRFPKTKEEKKHEKRGFDLRHTVHEAEAQNLKPVDPAHRFEVTLEPDAFTEEKFQLYKNYQVNVHHDEPQGVSGSGFRRFLCDSPLQRCVGSRDGKEQPMGSFHHCYRLDGRLIAMAVLDLLPHAVSGVYFVYHQDFKEWSFGKISAMREAALALETGYEYYYMGFYIHNCVKMRYKGDYSPQYILDPLTYEWHSLEGTFKALLDKHSLVSLQLDDGPAELGGVEDTSTARAGLDADSRVWRLSKNADEKRWPLKNAAEAARSRQSLLVIGIPGSMTAQEVMEQIDLDKIDVVLQGELFHTEDLQSWGESVITDNASLKGGVAELVACVGPEVANEMAVDFS